MSAQDAIDAARDLIQVSLMLGAPLLGAAVVAGILSAILQTATQIHEQSISFVSRLVAVAVAAGLWLPWLMSRLVEFAHQVLATVPHRL